MATFYRICVWKSRGDCDKNEYCKKEKHGKFVIALKEILENSVYLDWKPNQKTDNPQKKNVKNYHYFGATVKIGSKTYDVIFDTEQFKAAGFDKPRKVSHYNVYKKNESPFGSSTLASKYPIGDSNTILSQSNTNINPFLQSAFAGSRVDYNRASLKANPRGAYYNGTVYLFENADESTFVHEMAHAYMDVLERLAQGGNTKAQKDLDKIRK